MSTEPLDLDALRARYTPTRPPKCGLCGGKLSIQSFGSGQATKWACSDRPGGRDEAWYSHYEYSVWFARPSGDSDVLDLIDEVERYRATSERFTDPSVTEAIAREIGSIKPAGDCGFCRYGQPCPRHVAEHLVNAMREERLVVLTVQTADDIVGNIETAGASDGS